MFLQHYGASETKGSFPYETVKGVADLKTLGCSKQSNFFSSLKKQHILTTEYAVVQKVWIEKKMETWYDLLECYSLLDVRPILQAKSNYLVPYKERNLNLFKMALGLPGISIPWVFANLDPHEEKFHLFYPRDSDMGKLMRANLTGGLSNIFHRCQIKDKTPIRNNAKHIVKRVVGYDANSLYLSSNGKEMPTGMPQIYRIDKKTN